MENFKPIKKFEGFYEVSDLGRIKSVSRKVKNKSGYRVVSEKILNPVRKPDGYCIVSLWKKDKNQSGYIHRLVALHFVDGKKNGYEVNHKNGDKGDNRAENLEWVTRSENILHSFKIGSHKPQYGTLSSKAKLTEPEVKHIKSKYAQGEISIRALAEIYGVHHSIIHGIVSGKRWSHVKV